MLETGQDPARIVEERGLKQTSDTGAIEAVIAEVLAKNPNQLEQYRGGKEALWQDEEAERVIFHTDRGSTYTANAFTTLCRHLGIRQSMGRVGSCFDNAAAEAFFSSLEWEVLSRHEFENTRQAQAVVLDWCYGFYNHHRRHSSAGMMSPIDYENTAAATPAAA